MTAGFQAWDAAGNLVVDLTDRLPRRVGTISVAAGGSGSIAVPGTQAIWYYVSSSGSLRASLYAPIMGLSGRTLSWSVNTVFDSASRVPVAIVYGVY